LEHPITDQSDKISTIKLSILIVNYNGKHFLDECIKSLKTNILCTYEIIIVDNFSSDDSVRYIKAKYPEIKLIESNRNIGFSCGNNLGAHHTSGEYLLLLNNDTKLLNSLKPAIDLLDFNKQIGVVGCRMYYVNGKLQHSIGKNHTPFSLPLSWLPQLSKHSILSKYSRIQYDSLYYKTIHKNVSWVSGAFLLTRKAIWSQLKGMDPSFFMYVEDVDFCKRVRDKNLSIAYTPDVSIIHYEGAGKRWIGERAVTMTTTSYNKFLRKHYGKKKSFLSMSFIGVVFIIRSIAYYSLYVCKSNNDNLDKAKAYGRNGIRLMFGQY